MFNGKIAKEFYELFLDFVNQNKGDFYNYHFFKDINKADIELLGNNNYYVVEFSAQKASISGNDTIFNKIRMSINYDYKNNILQWKTLKEQVWQNVFVEQPNGIYITQTEAQWK